METVTLTNGKVVANFSSPHPFHFEDGTVLPAVSNFLSEKLKIVFHEKEYDNGDIKLSFSLSNAVLEEIFEVMQLKDENHVDVVFCPLPMIVAIKEEFGEKWLINSPFRSIRVEDRINKVISINKQCI
jgi:hypothetical protein